MVQETSPFRLWYPDYNFGYRLRTYSADPLINLGKPVTYYDKVTEYSSENFNKNWKTTYEYSSKSFDTKQYFVTDHGSSIDYPRKYSNPYREWTGGKLKFKTMYKRNGNTFNKVLKESYNYETFIVDGVWDMPTYRHVHFLIDLQPYSGEKTSTQYWFNAEKIYNECCITPIGYGCRLYFSGSENLINKTVEHFDKEGNSNITKTDEYSFERLYNQVRLEKFTNSDDKVTRLEYEYPFDDLSVPINSKMVALNMVGVPLIKSQFGSDTFLQSTRTLYGEWSPFSNNWGIDSNLYINIIRPRTQYFKKGSNTEESIIEYHSYYSSGKVKEVSKVDGTHIVYIWGYYDEYPIAKIENASFSDIPITVYNAIISASNSDINSTTENALRGKLDALRNTSLCPNLSSAMISTYTYDPLIGVTSITDPKGYTMYYEYDDFGRLEHVKDAASNILSTNEYNYKQ